jgi:hypothetical protein
MNNNKAQKKALTSTNRTQQGGINEQQQSIVRKHLQATIEHNKGAPMSTNKI